MPYPENKENILHILGTLFIWEPILLKRMPKSRWQQLINCNGFIIQIPEAMSRSSICC
jgi:hypothetical protein